MTVEKTVTYQDTILTAPAASTSMQISLNEISKGVKAPLTAQNRQAKATLTQSGQHLIVTCDCDTLAIAAQMKATYEKQATERVIQLPSEQVRYTPWYTKILAILGGVSLLGISSILVFILLKPIR